MIDARNDKPSAKQNVNATSIKPNQQRKGIGNGSFFFAQKIHSHSPQQTQ